MKKVVWGLVILLILLHQDFWFWDNSTLLFGFMPITLLYHAFISMAAAATWFLATKYAWPEDLIEAAVEEAGSTSAASEATPTEDTSDAAGHEEGEQA